SKRDWSSDVCSSDLGGLRGGDVLGVENLADERFALLARRVLPVELHRRRERGIVLIRGWRLLLAELRLRAHVRPQEALGGGMKVVACHRHCATARLRWSLAHGSFPLWPDCLQLGFRRWRSLHHPFCHVETPSR